jgi:chitodextrinase/DNA-binding XRE family transcriptional regulator
MIGETIKKVRTKLGLIQDDLVRKSGVKNTTLTKIESNVVVKPSVQTGPPMSKLLRIIWLTTLLLGGTAGPNSAHAYYVEIGTLPWSSTFAPSVNCVAGSWLYGDRCDGIEVAGGGACANVVNDEITSAANYLGGGGGNGMRHYIGDGQNIGGQGMGIYFSSPYLTEFYFRWYMRYQAGFAWSTLGYQKLIYPNPQSAVLDFVNGNDWSLTSQNTGVNYTRTGGGWHTIQANGQATSDGNWHAYEVRMKAEVDGNDGILEVWVDGAKIWSRLDINMDSINGRPFTGFGILTNQNSPSNGGCVAVDLDDFAISTSGPIGPIGGSNPLPDTTAPTISLTTPTSGSTVSGTTVTLSATASDNTGVSSVQFLLDGTNLGTEDTTAPYSITWNTTSATNASHTLTARARDAAGNQTISAAVTVTTSNIVVTPDTTPPTTPTSLSATPTSSSAINLSWSASSDNVGVAGYRIYRNGTQIGTVTTNTYSNTGLSPSTSYTYTVSAYDAAGNASAQSTSASGSTQSTPVVTATPPPPPPSTITNTPPASGAIGSTATTPTPPATIPTVSTPTTPSTPPTSSLSLTRNLYRGTKGTDVQSLQTFLIQQNYLAPTNNTGFYGSLTKQAVEKYQCAKNLICSGTEVSTGYGVVGPKTRTSLNTATISTGTTTSFTTNLTPAQVDAILSVLESFGAEQAVIEQVKRSLGR